MANASALFRLRLAWSKTLRVIKHLWRIGSKNPRLLFRSPVFRALRSSGFWMKLKTVLRLVGRSVSYISAIVMIVEFLVAKRDLTVDEAVAVAKEKGVEGFLNEVDDPHAFLERYIGSLPFKDKSDKEMVMLALEHDRSSVAAIAEGPAQGNNVTLPVNRVNPGTSLERQVEVIESSRTGELGLARSNPSARTAPMTASTQSVMATIALRAQAREFHRAYGFSALHLLRSLAPFGNPDAQAALAALEQHEPDLYY